MFSSKQTHKFVYFICYLLESGWHVTRPNQGLSLGRGKSLGTRLGRQAQSLREFQEWAIATSTLFSPFYALIDLKYM